MEKKFGNLNKRDLHSLCQSNHIWLPGKFSSSPCDKNLILSMLCKHVICIYSEDVREVNPTSKLSKAELWATFKKLSESKCPGGFWPEKVRDRGMTNMDILKCIKALSPDHPYFDKNFEAGYDDSDSDLCDDSDEARRWPIRIARARSS